MKASLYWPLSAWQRPKKYQACPQEGFAPTASFRSSMAFKWGFSFLVDTCGMVWYSQPVWGKNGKWKEWERWWAQ